MQGANPCSPHKEYIFMINPTELIIEELAYNHQSCTGGFVL